MHPTHKFFYFQKNYIFYCILFFLMTYYIVLHILYVFQKIFSIFLDLFYIFLFPFFFFFFSTSCKVRGRQHKSSSRRENDACLLPFLISFQSVHILGLGSSSQTLETDDPLFHSPVNGLCFLYSRHYYIILYTYIYWVFLL